MRKKTKTTTGVDATLFFTNFVGELVEIMTNRISVVTTQTEEGTETGEYPWAITGYLLDEDENFYYIGKSPTEVNSAIKKEIVLGVTIVDNPDNRIMESIGNPKDRGDLN